MQVSFFNLYLTSINTLQKTKLSQSEIVLLLKKREESGFNYLYENYSGALYSTILKVVIFQDEAAEVLQDVFVKIWNSIQSFDEEKGTIYTWMLNIARNSAIDKIRSKAFKNNQKNQAIPDFVNDTKQLTNEQIHNFGEVKNVVNQLREDYKEVINQAYFGGYTQEEISENLGIPLGTVKTRTRAAFQELRALLSEYKNNF